MECGITIPPCFRNPKATGQSLCEAQRSPVRGRLRLPARSPMTVSLHTLRPIRFGPRALLSGARRAGRRAVPSKTEAPFDRLRAFGRLRTRTERSRRTPHVQRLASSSPLAPARVPRFRIHIRIWIHTRPSAGRPSPPDSPVPPSCPARPPPRSHPPPRTPHPVNPANNLRYFKATDRHGIT